MIGHNPWKGRAMSRQREIADDLRRRIHAGEWAAGQTIPRMIDLVAEYNASRSTITAVIRELEGEGLLISIKRKGTVIMEARPRRRIVRGVSVHRRRLLEGGYSFAATQPGEPTWTHHVPPTRRMEPIPPRPAVLLGLKPGDLAFRRRRVTSPEGEPPFTLSDSWIPVPILEAAPRVGEQGPPGGYLDAIEAAGHGPLSWHEVTRARMPEREEAALLGIPVRVPVLEICRVSVSASTGAPVEVTVMVIPSDRVETVVELQRDETAAYEVLSPAGGPHSLKEL